METVTAKRKRTMQEAVRYCISYLIRIHWDPFLHLDDTPGLLDFSSVRPAVPLSSLDVSPWQKHSDTGKKVRWYTTVFIFMIKGIQMQMRVGSVKNKLWQVTLCSTILLNCRHLLSVCKIVPAHDYTVPARKTSLYCIRDTCSRHLSACTWCCWFIAKGLSFSRVTGCRLRCMIWFDAVLLSLCIDVIYYLFVTAVSAVILRICECVGGGFWNWDLGHHTNVHILELVCSRLSTKSIFHYTPAKRG